MKDIGRRLPLEQQCSLYQGQQGDVSQSVRGNYKTRFCRGQHLTAVEGKASVYQVYPVSRTTGEGRDLIYLYQNACVIRSPHALRTRLLVWVGNWLTFNPWSNGLPLGNPPIHLNK